MVTAVPTEERSTDVNGKGEKINAELRRNNKGWSFVNCQQRSISKEGRKERFGSIMYNILVGVLLFALLLYYPLYSTPLISEEMENYDRYLIRCS